MGSTAKMQENVELESFLVTKHSWKGKYKRILTIGSQSISTYNPDKFDMTNRWSYSDIISAAPNKTGNVSRLFQSYSFKFLGQLKYHEMTGY